MNLAKTWFLRTRWVLLFCVLFALESSTPDAKFGGALTASLVFTVAFWVSWRVVRLIINSDEMMRGLIPQAPVPSPRATKKPSVVELSAWDVAERSLTRLVLRVQELSLDPSTSLRYPGMLDRDNSASRAFLDFYDEALLRHFHGDRAEEVLFTHAVDSACRMFGIARREAQRRAVTHPQ